MKITVRISDEMNEALDKEFTKSDFKIKNDFYNNIFTGYCLCKNPTVANFLPDIVKGICQSEIHEHDKLTRELVTEVTKTIELACAKIINLSNNLADYIPQEDIYAE